MSPSLSESDIFFGTIIHTDGSVIERSTRSVAILISGGKYLTELVEVREIENNSYYAELVAIEVALLWVERHISEVAIPIRLYTDNLSIYDVSQNYKAKPPKRQAILWQSIIRLITLFNVTILYKKGHNRDINPNVVCDRLAGVECTHL